MIQLPIAMPGVMVWHDLRSRQWTIRGEEQTYTLHEWNWGQRQQLVRTAIVSGRFERELFIDGVFDLLLAPLPPSNRQRYAFLCLHLLGVPEALPALSLARAELLLAQALGWRPTELADQSVAALDAMVQLLTTQDATSQAVRQPTVSDEGWTSIIVRPDPVAAEIEPQIPPEQSVEITLRLRLEGMLEAVTAWAGVSPAPAPMAERLLAHANIPTPSAKFVSSQESFYPDANPMPGKQAEVTAAEQAPENRDQPSKGDWPQRFGGTVRLKRGLLAKTSHESTEVSTQRASAVHPQSGPPHLKTAGTSTPPQGSDQYPGSSPELAAAISRGAMRASQQPSGPANAVDQGWEQDLNRIQSADRSSPIQSPAPLGKVATRPASATPWGDFGAGATRSGVWPDLSTPRDPHKSWETSSTTLPMQRHWEAASRVTGKRGAQREMAGEAAARPVQQQAWNAQLGDEPKLAALASQENQLETLQDSLALSGVVFENPFALSEFEERLADVLERAAVEAGIDLP